MFQQVKNFMKKVKHLLREHKKEMFYGCRLLEISKTDEDEYVATIQIANKSQIVYLKPEEILADDTLTKLFSPIDVRTLTYLGYLGINKPKYKILAQKLSKKDNKLLFAIQEQGQKKPILISAEQISQNPDIIASLAQEDAHKIGFLHANEQLQEEKKQKEKLLEKKQKPIKD